MNKHVIKVGRSGAADSKYFGQTELFDKDIQDRKTKNEIFKRRIKELITENPAEMDVKYRLALDALIELKKEFDL